MADMFDAVTRSRIMSAVRTRKTAPELRLGVALQRLGLAFRCNDASVFGTPDVCYRRLRLAVFVDGDFWHGRAWFERGEAPVQNREFWIAKFEINRQRDRTVDGRLRRSGWSVIRIWASDLRKDPDRAVALIVARIRRRRSAAAVRRQR